MLSSLAPLGRAVEAVATKIAIAANVVGTLLCIAASGGIADEAEAAPVCR